MWKALYADGTTTTDDQPYASIDRGKLVLFQASMDEETFYTLEVPPGKRLVYRMRTKIHGGQHSSFMLIALENQSRTEITGALIFPDGAVRPIASYGPDADSCAPELLPEEFVYADN